VQKQIEALSVEQLTKDFDCRIAEQQKQIEALTAGAESERTNRNEPPCAADGRKR
jgi:hypothetical protein